LLIRFRPDVIALKPKVVVILAGINDLAWNTGPTTSEEIEGCLTFMVELAKANGIRVVLASVLPANKFPWRPHRHDRGDERMVEGFRREERGIYLAYHSAMADAEKGLKAEFAEDAVHPNKAGYAVMGPLAERPS
jgi:lysophospholipase L1-like esterase